MAVNTFRYNIQERETKRYGKVYDVYFYVDGKQKCLRGHKTKTAAKQAFNDFMEQTLTAPKIEPTTKRLYYEDARRQYFNAIQYTVKESSLYDFKHTGSKYHDVYFKRKDLMRLTKQDVLGFQDWLYTQKKENGQPYSPQMLVKVYRQFCTFYRWCILRYEAPNVLSNLQFAKKRVQKKELDVWTRADFDRFIDDVDNPKYKAMFTTLFYCGLRVGEAQALKVKDYDGATLFIHSTYTKKTLDGSAYKITETKNYKARRVPVPAPCKAVLDEWVQNRPSDEFLFGNGSPASLNPIRTYFDTHIERAGVSRIRIHDLRHSYVSMLLSLGASVPTVASLIGDTIEQVVKTYAHSIEDDKIAIISKIV